jgi:hypothetical protein
MKALLVLWFSAWFSNVTVGQYVDDLDPLLRANRDACLSGPHTVARRDEAIVYFDQQSAWLKTNPMRNVGQHVTNTIPGSASGRPDGIRPRPVCRRPA